MPHQTKPNAKAKIEEGKQQIEKKMTQIQQNDKVQAATRAAKDGANKAKKRLLDLFGMGNKSPQQPQLQPQNQFGGKRRRKSRRKKRTKRRRKSRRKKRRTKRRRKSRRKRRR